MQTLEWFRLPFELAAQFVRLSNNQSTESTVISSHFDDGNMNRAYAITPATTTKKKTTRGRYSKSRLHNILSVSSGAWLEYRSFHAPRIDFKLNASRIECGAKKKRNIRRNGIHHEDGETSDGEVTHKQNVTNAHLDVSDSTRLDRCHICLWWKVNTPESDF